jgi:hypothetical protein
MAVLLQARSLPRASLPTREQRSDPYPLLVPLQAFPVPIGWIAILASPRSSSHEAGRHCGATEVQRRPYGDGPSGRSLARSGAYSIETSRRPGPSRRDPACRWSMPGFDRGRGDATESLLITVALIHAAITLRRHRNPGASRDEDALSPIAIRIAHSSTPRDRSRRPRRAPRHAPGSRSQATARHREQGGLMSLASAPQTQDATNSAG